MPSAQLVSTALYTFPTIGNQFSELELVPNADGLKDLAARFAKSSNNDPRVDKVPSDRTVKKLLTKNDFVKFKSCNNLRRMLNAVRVDEGLPKLPSKEVIAEHEFFIVQLQARLEGNAGGFTKPLKYVASETGMHFEMLRAMCKGHRTTHRNCEIVRDVLNTKYEIKLDISNHVAVKVGKPKNLKDTGVRPVKASLLRNEQLSFDI